MKQLLRTEPAVIVGTVQSILVLVAAFGFDLISPEQAAAIVAFVSAATILIRSVVASPATAATLARGTLQTKPTPRQTDKAKSILGIDQDRGVVVPPELKRLAIEYAKYLPMPYPEIVAAVGVAGLEVAVKAAQNATKRPLTRDESKEAIRDLGADL